MFIELHDNPDRIGLNDSNQTHDVGVIQIFHQVFNRENPDFINVETDRDYMQQWFLVILWLFVYR